MAYARTYTLDDSPTGDTVKAAIVNKIDPDLTAAYTAINTHEALTATHGAAGAIVGTTSTQELTNKTLTSPIMSGTITGTSATFINATLSGTITGTAATLTNATLTGTITGTGAVLTNATLTGTITASGVSWVGLTTVPTGGVIMHGAETAPTGFLECNGAAVSRTTYAALYAVIGNLWGNGNGSSTFNVPDMRGYFPRGWDHGAGNDTDAASRTAPTGGSAGDHVGTIQSAAISSHLHGVSITSGNESADHTHYLTPGPQGAYFATAAFGYDFQAGGAPSGSAATGGTSASHTHAVSGNTAATGDATGNDTRPKNRALMFIIKT